MSNFHRLRDDQETLVEDEINQHLPPADHHIIITEDRGSPAARGNSFNDRWRPVIAAVVSHVHFEIGIVLLVVLYSTFVLLEMTIDLGLMTVDRKSPVPHWLHLMGCSILGYFVMEVCLRLYAFGPELCSSRIEMFDMTVVVTTFVLELVFINHEDAYSSSGLLIILRLWRISNIVNVMLNNVREEKSKQIDTLKKEIYSYKKQNNALQDKNDRLQQKVRFYQLELESRGISVEYETFEDLQSEQLDGRIQEPTSPGQDGQMVSGTLRFDADDNGDVHNVVL